MAITPSSPITATKDVTITGFTAPTYTPTEDRAPTVNGKQWILAPGGTQASVTSHSVSSPFTVSIFRPMQPKLLPASNPTTGLKKAVARNKYTVVTRKGVTPYSGAAVEVMPIRTEISVPAGVDSYDTPNLKAAIASHIMFLQDIADSLCTAVQTASI